MVSSNLVSNINELLNLAFHPVSAVDKIHRHIYRQQALGKNLKIHSMEMSSLLCGFAEMNRMHYARIHSLVRHFP